MILRITDGTTTCDLVWHSAANRKYMLARDGWAPAVAPLRMSELGGVGPYEDVIEEIEIHVLGESQAEVLTNFTALGRLLDQAWRWWRGESVNAVRLQYTPDGSAHMGEAAILGRATGDQTSGVGLPVTVNRDLNMLMISGLQLRFLRRGLWLGDTDTATVAAAAVPTVMTATFAANHPQLSPLKVDFTGAPGLAGSTVIIAVTAAGGQEIIEAESGTMGADTTSVADAANSARGGSVARYTSPGGTAADQIILTISSLSASARRFVVIAAVRKNTAADVFDLSFGFRKVSGAFAAVLTTTETQRISSSVTTPQLLIFNPASTRDQPNSLVVNIIPITTAVGRTFDIDYVAIVAVDDNANTILTAVWPSMGAGETIEVDATVLESTPRVQVATSTGVNFAMTYTGDPSAFGVRGNQVACALYATGGAGTPTKWRMWDSTGAAVAQLGLSLARERGYLVPS